MVVLKKFLNDDTKKFHSDDTKKVTKYLDFICQALKCLKKLKIHSTK